MKIERGELDSFKYYFISNVLTLIDWNAASGDFRKIKNVKEMCRDMACNLTLEGKWRACLEKEKIVRREKRYMHVENKWTV